MIMKLHIPSWLPRLHLACTFLTRLPLPPPQVGPDQDLAQTMALFPLVGLLIGAVGGLVFWGAGHVLGPWPAAILAVAVMMLATGALHEDGLADLADGLGARGDMIARMEAMRDPHTGTYGTLALLMTVLLRCALLAAAPNGWAGAAALMAAAALSRAAIPALMQTLPPARNDGLGAGAGVPDFSTAAFACAIAVNITLLSVGFAATVGALGLAIAAAIWVGWLARRAIGGFTGDVLGAVQQMTEIAVLAGIASQW